MRKITRQIAVGKIPIGGGAPVVIQSMTNTRTEDSDATLAQIESLAQAGCPIVRLTIPNTVALESFKKIRTETDVALVADIHFRYELAVGAIEAGADKVRINPGNIGSDENVRYVVDAARSAGVPIRIGVNSGSLEPEILKKHLHPTPQALLESALHNIRRMESFNFDNFILSIKAPDVMTTIKACTLLAEQSDYPQHIGITESGTVKSGTIRSSVGLGALLANGIGDTLRVSLAGDPLHEVFVAKEILKSLNLAKGPVVIACPTCGRTDIDVAGLAAQVEELVKPYDESLTIAVMGCVVNGPGEAREADIGIAGGKGEGILFVKGEKIRKVAEAELLSALKEQIEHILAQKKE